MQWCRSLFTQPLIGHKQQFHVAAHSAYIPWTVLSTYAWNSNILFDSSTIHWIWLNKWHSRIWMRCPLFRNIWLHSPMEDSYHLIDWVFLVFFPPWVVTNLQIMSSSSFQIHACLLSYLFISYTFNFSSAKTLLGRCPLSRNHSNGHIMFATMFYNIVIQWTSVEIT